MENLLPKSLLGSSNRRAIIAGASALILAVILLLVYLSHYRNSVNSSNSTSSVLVAQSFIQKGTGAVDAAKRGLWELTPIPKDELKEGAVSDSALFQGQVALTDIYPGQQLTATDFGVTAIAPSLSGSADLEGVGPKQGTWRAIAIPLDSSHGISPQAQTGDHVDVYTAFNGVTTLFMPNVLIMAAPGQAATNTAAPASGNYILRVSSRDAPKFMYAADNTTLWFALRPQDHAKPPPKNSVSGSNFTG
jgi:Flp pilus assembly protein CpaB